MSDFTHRQRVALRTGLAVLAVTPAVIGIWATAAPRSFYDEFPGGGRHWVSALPPYNEHLLRDFAAANLAFLALAVFAGVLLERRLVQGTLIAFAVLGIPHLVYHLTTTGHYSTGDNVASIAGLALNALLPLLLLGITLERRTRRAAGGT